MAYGPRVVAVWLNHIGSFQKASLITNSCSGMLRSYVDSRKGGIPVDLVKGCIGPSVLLQEVLAKSRASGGFKERLLDLARDAFASDCHIGITVGLCGTVVSRSLCLS